MPPLPEDEDSGSGDDIPYKAPVEHVVEEESGEEEDEDDEQGPDEYVVEEIISHKIVRGQLVYVVKWEGYDEPKDRTEEPEENLATAKEVVKAYWKGHGPRPETKKGGKKRKAEDTPKASQAKRSKSETPELSTKKKSRASTGDEARKLPKGSWETHIEAIDTIEESVDEAGKPQRYVYVLWKTGDKSRHNIVTVNEKCPQKMLQYYESHLVFRNPDAIQNGDA